MARPRTITVAVAGLAVVAVLLTCWMITAGFGEADRTQRALLALSPLPVALVLAAGCAVSVWQRGLWPDHRVLLVTTSAAVLIGFVGVLAAVAAGGTGVLFQAVLWIGLGVTFCYVAWRIVRGQRVVTRPPRVIASLADLDLFAADPDRPDSDPRR